MIAFFVVVNTQTHQEKEWIAPDSAIALKGTQNTVVTMKAPVLTASVKATSLETTLSELLRNANASVGQAGQMSEIPQGTHLLGVTVQNNVVTVNLSDGFVSGGGSTSMIGRVEELKKAVTHIDKNYQVKIAINGKLVDYLGGEGLEVNQ